MRLDPLQGSRFGGPYLESPSLKTWIRPREDYFTLEIWTLETEIPADGFLLACCPLDFRCYELIS